MDLAGGDLSVVLKAGGDATNMSTDDADSAQAILEAVFLMEAGEEDSCVCSRDNNVVQDDQHQRRGEVSLAVNPNRNLNVISSSACIGIDDDIDREDENLTKQLIIGL